MELHVASLYRYPVKGLSPERVSRAGLLEGGYFPGDRLYAVENGPSGFDPHARTLRLCLSVQLTPA